MFPGGPRRAVRDRHRRGTSRGLLPDDVRLRLVGHLQRRRDGAHDRHRDGAGLGHRRPAAGMGQRRPPGRSSRRRRRSEQLAGAARLHGGVGLRPRGWRLGRIPQGDASALGDASRSGGLRLRGRQAAAGDRPERRRHPHCQHREKHPAQGGKEQLSHGRHRGGHPRHRRQGGAFCHPLGGQHAGDPADVAGDTRGPAHRAPLLQRRGDVYRTCDAIRSGRPTVLCPAEVAERVA
mmetsp:Transcript_2768/g.7791  ORF Transcript_2768/g.7791 Transcript_2768/m.7791 type:complete len:235 (+) Transcript_2768:224-928(+)